MLGLRYFVCDRCGVVHSAVEEPATCARCDGEILGELSGGTDISYFTKGLRTDG